MSTLSPRRRTALIACGIFLFLSGLAIHGPSPVSNAALQVRLQRAADKALFDVQAEDWAFVRVRGQVAYISGLAPSYQEKEQALQAIWHASWVGGVVAGGITQIHDDIQLVEGAEQFGLKAELKSGQLTLIGYAPDTQSSSRIRALAERLFAGRVDIKFSLAPGSAPLGWENAVRLLLSELARLETGTATIHGNNLVLHGVGATSQSVEVVRSAFLMPPPGFESAVLVRLEKGRFSNRIRDPELCRLAMKNALGLAPIALLDNEDAVLSLDSLTALNRAGLVRARCDLEVMGIGVKQGFDPAIILAPLLESQSSPEDYQFYELDLDDQAIIRFQLLNQSEEPVISEPIQTGE